MGNVKKSVFMIMPFQDEFFEVYEMLKRELGEVYEFTNAGDEGNQQNILHDIIEPIYKADIVIADMTGLNPNVMYELGIAHTFNKKTIIITKDDLAKLPFDLKQYRAKDYSTHFKKFAELIEYLKTNMEGAISGEVTYSNPVKDFLKLSGIDNDEWFSDKAIVLGDDTDKGFLDFLAEIEENANLLSEDISNMSEEMEKMTSGIEKCTSEVNRVKDNGGNGTVAFVRKESQKVAKYMSKFSTELKAHNYSIETLWDKVENNTLGLIENHYAIQNENKQSLVEYLNSLKNMQTSIGESNKSVIQLKDILNSCSGIERSMNQAIKFLVEDLTTYIENTERISVSIDKIITKSKFIVGDIN